MTLPYRLPSSSLTRGVLSYSSRRAIRVLPPCGYFLTFRRGPLRKHRIPTLHLLPIPAGTHLQRDNMVLFEFLRMVILSRYEKSVPAVRYSAFFPASRRTLGNSN